MMIDTDNKTFQDDLLNECKVINLKNEYSDYLGEINWAIVSDLTEEELNEKYRSAILPYSPYVRLSLEQYEAIKEYNSNEYKHVRRMKCKGDRFCFDEGIYCFHSELVMDESECIDWSWLYKVIEKLPLVQRRRIVKKFYLQLNNVEIARQERVSSQAVDLSIKMAINRLRKLMKAN